MSCCGVEAAWCEPPTMLLGASMLGRGSQPALVLEAGGTPAPLPMWINTRFGMLFEPRVYHFSKWSFAVINEAEGWERHLVLFYDDLSYHHAPRQGSVSRTG